MRSIAKGETDKDMKARIAISKLSRNWLFAHGLQKLGFV